MNATDESGGADEEADAVDESTVDVEVDDAIDDVAVDSVEAAPTDANDDESDVEQDGSDEPFTRYQNSIYRLISMGGAALIAVLGITGFAIGRTLDPAPPPSFFIVDGIVALVLFGWYLLGMRCRLDVAETWVHIATKYGDFRIDRAQVVSVDADRSLVGSLQFSGRPLIITYRPDLESEQVKTRKAFGCLPNDARSQQAVVEELQAELGEPDATVSSGRSLEEKISDAAAGQVISESDRSDVESAVAARLAKMKPEGDGGPSDPEPPDKK